MGTEIQKIYAKISDYQKKYPLYTREVILDLMVQENVISKDVADKLKSGKSLFLIDKPFIKSGTEDNDYNVTEIFGGNFTTKFYKKTQEPTVPYRAPQQTSGLDLKKTYPNLLFTPNGEIDFDSYTLDKLKTLFPDKDFVIESGNRNDRYFINVKSKINNNIVFSYSKNRIPNIGIIESVSFNENGKLNALVYTNGKFTSRESYKFNGDNILIDTCEYYDENKNLTRLDIWNEDNTSFVEKEYSNGILYKEITYVNNGNFFDITEVKNILLDKLIQDITENAEVCKGSFGFFPKADDLEKYILQGISKNNVFMILSDYNGTTKHSLIQDLIDNKIGLSHTKQKKIIKHLATLLLEAYEVQSDDEHYWEGKTLGYEMQFALGCKDTEVLKDALDKVNKDNIENVFNTIFKIDENCDFTDYSDRLYPLLLQILGNDAGRYLPKLINAMIQNIAEKGGYSKDLEEDINSHLDSWNKSAVDFTRLLNRCKADKVSTINGKPDGKIDINNVNQKGTGDCWLIAAILSATNKNQKGLDYVNSILSVDSKGNVTVHLKGIDKKYVISAEEITKSNHLASGDPDMRAIEIAVDKYMKETAYEATSKGKPDFSQSDINGDKAEIAYRIIFGNGDCDTSADITNKDFNSENQVYTLSFGQNPNLEATVIGSKKEQDVIKLIARHAYAIKRSDDKYIYLINPHNSSETLRVERAFLQNKDLRIYSALIDMDEWDEYDIDEMIE